MSPLTRQDYNDRLLKLATFLENLPAHKFRFDIITDIQDKPLLEALAHPEMHCGTVACAVGWMPAVFPDLAEWYFDARMSETRVRSKENQPAHASWDEAAQAVFALDEHEAHWLFAPSLRCGDDATPQEVATQIRLFVRARGIV